MQIVAGPRDGWLITIDCHLHSHGVGILYLDARDQRAHAVECIGPTSVIDAHALIARRRLRHLLNERGIAKAGQNAVSTDGPKRGRFVRLMHFGIKLYHQFAGAGDRSSVGGQHYRSAFRQ